MADKNLFIVTTKQNQQIDLTKGKELRSNNLYPFGRHNYAIYLAPDGQYIKGTNVGSATHMLDTYDIISETEALNYKHQYVRED